MGTSGRDSPSEILPPGWSWEKAQGAASSVRRRLAPLCTWQSRLLAGSGPLPGGTLYSRSPGVLRVWAVRVLCLPGLEPGQPFAFRNKAGRLPVWQGRGPSAPAQARERALLSMQLWGARGGPGGCCAWASASPWGRGWGPGRCLGMFPFCTAWGRCEGASLCLGERRSCPGWERWCQGGPSCSMQS